MGHRVGWQEDRRDSVSLRFPITYVIKNINVNIYVNVYVNVNVNVFIERSPCFGRRTLARRSPKRASLFRRPPFFRDFFKESPQSKRLLGALGRFGGGVEPPPNRLLPAPPPTVRPPFRRKGAFLMPPFGHRTLGGTG